MSITPKVKSKKRKIIHQMFIDVYSCQFHKLIFFDLIKVKRQMKNVRDNFTLTPALIKDYFMQECGSPTICDDRIPILRHRVHYTV